MEIVYNCSCRILTIALLKYVLFKVSAKFVNSITTSLSGLMLSQIPLIWSYSGEVKKTCTVITEPGNPPKV